MRLAEMGVRKIAAMSCMAISQGLPSDKPYYHE